MKIVYCIGSLAQAGGVERVLINKANFLADSTVYDVTILIAKQNNSPICYPVSKNVKIVDLDIKVSTAFLSKIPVLGFFLTISSLKKQYQRVLDELKPDIVINVERGYEDFIIPSLKKGYSTIRESHSSKAAVKIMDTNSYLLSFYNLKKKYFTYLYNRQLQKFDKVVLLTHQDAKERGYPNGDVVIPNLVSSFDIDVKYNAQSKKVISVGRLDQFKNFKDQILVWKDIVELYPDWTLHIYGDGPDKNNLIELIQQCQLDKNVFLEGKSAKIQEHYAASSFFIFTSVAEGFGMVLVEAMQLGLPVVSYDCPCGPSEIIEEGKDGFLVKVSDTKTLKKHMLNLIADENLRIAMSQQAIQKSKKFLPEVIMPQWMDLFQKLHNGK